MMPTASVRNYWILSSLAILHSAALSVALAAGASVAVVWLGITAFAWPIILVVHPAGTWRRFLVPLLISLAINYKHILLMAFLWVCNRYGCHL